jgi:hypothetical protein
MPPVGRLFTVDDEALGDAARKLLDIRANRRVVADAADAAGRDAG